MTHQLTFLFSANTDDVYVWRPDKTLNMVKSITFTFTIYSLIYKLSWTETFFFSLWHESRPEVKPEHVNSEKSHT